MLHPIVLTTTTLKVSLKARRELGIGLKGPRDHVRILLDVYDIVRVIELPQECAGQSERCRVSYNLEEKAGDDKEETSVQHVTVLHTLDEVIEMMEEAKTEKPDWMD